MAIQYEVSENGSSDNVKIDDNPTSTRKSTHWYKVCSLQYIILIIMLGVAILASIVTLVVLLVKDTPDVQHTIHSESNDNQKLYAILNNSSTNTDGSNDSTSLKIISKRQWLAQPPTDALTPLQLPVPYVIIMDTATENCSNIGQCIFQARFIQSFHMESRGWSDIGYNFLIGGNGNILEGRGWKSQGAHTYGYNAKSLGIAFMGTFNSMLPPATQINAAKKLIKNGVEMGYIAKDYKLFAARQLVETVRPGLLLYKDIMNWPHWSEHL